MHEKHAELQYQHDYIMHVCTTITHQFQANSYVDLHYIPSAAKHPEVIDRELEKECANGRILGPFHNPPLPHLHCSGLGAAPKKDGRWGMVMHLSAPAGHSINDAIPKEDFSLQYSTVDDAIRMILQLGTGTLMAKVDLKSAFRMVPVHRDDWELLGMHWRNQFFMDTCLPFGLRSAPYLFNEVAMALEWIMKSNYDIPHIIHYLDDFLMVGPPSSARCSKQLQRFAAFLGTTVAMEKVDGPAATLVFLGLVLDSVHREIHPPPREATGHLSRTPSMGRPQAYYQAKAALTHRKALVHRKSSASRVPLPATADRTEHFSKAVVPSYQPNESGPG